MNPEFWQGKKVLVTGHTGFKGGWLCLWLQNLGANVLGYALDPPTKPSLFDVAQVAKGMTSIEGDVRDLKNLNLCINRNKPEIIIHMAAQSLVRYSYVNPVETYTTNIIGTVNVLEAVRGSDSVKVVVVVTSDKCYENKEWVWGYRENEPMGGYDPYSSSKGCAELVTAAYQRSFFNIDNKIGHGAALASVRAGNVIGGGDWADDRLIPDIVNAFVAQRPVIIRNPEAVRPWQHVLEPLNGYMKLTERLWNDGKSYSEAWNFGPDDSDTRPVSWLVEHISELWEASPGWQLEKNSQPHEANYLKLDCSKARGRLNWSPLLNLETAIDWIVEWYREYQNNRDMRAVSINQIERYQGAIDK